MKRSRRRSGKSAFSVFGEFLEHIRRLNDEQDIFGGEVFPTTIDMATFPVAAISSRMFGCFAHFLAQKRYKWETASGYYLSRVLLKTDFEVAHPSAGLFTNSSAWSVLYLNDFY